jgi:hypothetical protein
MKKIPCKDCLCFPICKTQAVRKNFQEKLCVILFILDDKCELFSEWYRSVEYLNNAKIEIVKCFGTTSAVWVLWEEDSDSS